MLGPDGAPVPAGPALGAAGIAPVELAEKEGLALINGTDGMLGMLLLALADIDVLCDSGDVSDHPYQAQFQAFFDALEAGRDMPLTSFKDAKRTFDVIFAADRSAAEGGRPVPLS